MDRLSERTNENIMFQRTPVSVDPSLYICTTKPFFVEGQGRSCQTKCQIQVKTYLCCLQTPQKGNKFRQSVGTVSLLSLLSKSTEIASQASPVGRLWRVPYPVMMLYPAIVPRHVFQ